ncbi:molybdopterin biosynthesis MoaE protein [Nitrosococcus halophilus Nc 4]|uniref:Molybdopterin synthase catalytic subunit n=1 Tax=Nitrosococcus halophilus (strain Nc4) TaxID=472759 RepID=D5BW54_NITHN|nr:molybdenum cofactor biosynthesis protein MoaE [Nitrosococcus halophilus]ADE13704.1 molybdopterin biosynthesis MoaE protein [Nitrosococcus halophilus Nc 4]
MTVHIINAPFDPWQEVANYQQAYLKRAGRFGATACFIGTMRDFNEGENVQAMELEHYPGMTEKYLGKLTEEARRQWPILDSLIIHRYGHLQPNEPIVLVVVWSAHRAAAFKACYYLVEELKANAPFWKKETLATGTRWVESNTSS